MLKLTREDMIAELRGFDSFANLVQLSNEMLCDFYQEFIGFGPEVTAEFLAEDNSEAA